MVSVLYLLKTSSESLDSTSVLSGMLVSSFEISGRAEAEKRGEKSRGK